MARPPWALMKPTICLLNRTGEHHFDDLDGGAVGDAQAGGKFRFDAEFFQHGADLRAAAVGRRPD